MGSFAIYGRKEMELTRTATKALKFLAGFSEFTDVQPTVHIDRVRAVLTNAEIDRLVDHGGIEALPQQRGNIVSTRTFNVGKLEALSNITLQEARDEIKASRNV